MKQTLEELVRIAYRRWKADHPRPDVHPDEETFCQALEGTLGHGAMREFQEHVAVCDACAEVIAACLDAASAGDEPLPEELRESARRAVEAVYPAGSAADALEVAVRIKDNALELLRACGDVLVGQEYVPAAALRSRSREQRDFRATLTVIRDCGQLRCQVVLERGAAGGLRLSVSVSELAGGAPAGQGRFTLVHEGKELESRCSEGAVAVFETIPQGSSQVVFEDSAGRRVQVNLEVLS